MTATPAVIVTPTVSATATPTPSSVLTLNFQTTFEELGYSERVLISPWGSTQYFFRLPANWLPVEDGSYLDLRFSYFFTDLGAKKDELGLAFFGEMAIYADNRLLQVYSLNEPTLERVRLRMDLPSELFERQPGAYHEIRVDLSAPFLCNAPHEAKLAIHPESALFLNYTLLPPTLDLGDYPRPFFQRSFEPDQVRFVLPTWPSETEMRAAAVTAAGLGAMSSNRLVISATTDVDWLKMATTEQADPEHLLIIGQPDRNQLVSWLNDNVALPVPIYRRQMSLSSQGSAAVMPGDTFSYTLTVTNTTPVSTTSLSLTDRIAYQARLVDCHPACTKVSENEVSWSLESLSAGEAASFSVTFQLTDTAQLSSQTSFLENIATLANEAAVPLNISSLTTAIGPLPTGQKLVVSSGQGDYFFAQNGQPVPEGDGILQEIISPWDPQKVILLVTGANEEAVYKASQALGLRTPFPDMKGPVALIRQVRPSSLVTKTQAVDLTLADLGYSDQTFYGFYRQDFSFRFGVPWGWQLTDDAYLRLRFSHSQAIAERSSMLTVLLNDTPLTTVFLDRENGLEGDLQVHLPDSKIRPGASNKITLQISMEVNGEECEDIDIRQAWLSISRDSLLHLDREVQDVDVFYLDYFPFPFNTHSDLNDVLFVLPPAPGLVEQETLLWLAAALGDAAGGPGLNPAVSLGESLDAEMLSPYHIIAIGRPSSNPLIQQVNPLLPQPFVPGSDEVEQQVGEVILRLAPDVPLGYIQQIQSPWEQRRALLVVTGTTDQGVTWATDVLTRQAWRLSGNLALVRQREEGIEVQSIDTRDLTSSGLASTVATAMPELTPVVTITPTLEARADQPATPTQTPPSFSTTTRLGGLPTWVMLLAGATAVVVLVVFGVVIWRSRQQ